MSNDQAVLNGDDDEPDFDGPLPAGWGDVIDHAWGEVSRPRAAVHAWVAAGWDDEDAYEWLAPNLSGGYQLAGEWAHHPHAALAMQAAGHRTASDASAWCDRQGTSPSDLAEWLSAGVTNPEQAARLHRARVRPSEWRDADGAGRDAMRLLAGLSANLP